MFYLLPLLMLIPGATPGKEEIAVSAGIEIGEYVTILSGQGSILPTHMVVSRIVRSSHFSILFQPVGLNRK